MKKNIKSTKVNPKNSSPDLIDVIRDEDYRRAVAMLKKTLKKVEQSSGPNHLYVANVLNNLAALYHKYGKPRGAEPLFKSALAIEEKVLGPDHPDVARTLIKLAMVYEDLNQFSEAETYCERALEIREKALGTDHPDVINAMEDLARIYSNQKKHYAKAETLYEHVLEIRIKGLKPVLRTLQGLHYLHQSYGEQEKRKQYFKYYKGLLYIVNKMHSKLEIIM